MKLISESILSSNGASMAEIIKKWWDQVNYHDKQNYEWDGKSPYVNSNETSIIINKNFDDEYEKFIRFPYLKNVTLNNPIKDYKKRIPEAVKKVYITAWANGVIEDLPICEKLVIKDCGWFNILNHSDSNLKSLTIENCRKFKAIKNLPDSIEKLVITDCPSFDTIEGLPASIKEVEFNNCGITSLEGLPEKLAGNLTIVGCKNITNIESFPLQVKGSIFLSQNGRKFRKDEVEGRCKCRNITCR